MGHEDWLADFAWSMSDSAPTPLLASASQDARIRLWQFKTMLEDVTSGSTNVNNEAIIPSTDDIDLEVVDDDVEFIVDDEGAIPKKEPHA